VKREISYLVFLSGMLALSCGQQKSVSIPPQGDPRLETARSVKIRGVLKDQNGRHLEGTIGVLFAIYEDERGGASLWQETQNIQADEIGKYAAYLGASGSGSLGLPPTIMFSNKPLWLGILVLQSGETEQPRVLLKPTSDGLKLQRDTRIARTIEVLDHMPRDSGQPALQEPSTEASTAQTQPRGSRSRTSGIRHRNQLPSN
jgi:hypothetical protein